MATKLTKRSLDAIEPREKSFIAFDAEIRGFGVRIMPSGTKTFILEYRPGAGGRGVAKRRLTLGRYGQTTVEQARGAALNALAHIRLGISDPQAEKSRQRACVTLADLIGAFFQDHVSKLKPNTQTSYADWLEKVRAEYGTVKAEALTRAQLAALHRSMAATPYSANRMLAAVSSFFKWGEEEGHVPKGHANPAIKILRYPERAREKFLTSDEFERLGAALQSTKIDPFAVAAIRLLLLTGARLREILHAKWSEVDFERGLLNLSDSKTGAKSIFLNAAALAVFATQPRMSGNPFVFPGRKHDKPRCKLDRPWWIIRKAAGLPNLRIHDLRHTHASIGAGSWYSLQIIGKLLGHTQASTTQRYSHLADSPVRVASEAIGTAIVAAMAGPKK